MDVMPVISPDSDPRNSSTSPQSEASVIVSMVPDITRLFNPDLDIVSTTPLLIAIVDVALEQPTDDSSFSARLVDD
ncbi:hypothetical protein BT96DRAFT_992321 [Gymnopus androsaceus JB14]|uniref:Uncharacterized protein n=1 Tax=Gymnopus androsaceus JB14 TaxID=1447944 RepID=A0A6A4HRU8_9AGAR|nr:hypothetical protein BT96DRAFT_992321 [Gymnopus androsaceus JB14]